MIRNYLRLKTPATVIKRIFSYLRQQESVMNYVKFGSYQPPSTNVIISIWVKEISIFHILFRNHLRLGDVGVYVDTELSFVFHVEEVMRRALRIVYVLFSSLAIKVAASYIE